MEFAAKTDILKTKIPAANKETYLQIEKILELPAKNPDIDRLVSFSGRIESSSGEVSDYKVKVSGNIIFRMVYFGDADAYGDTAFSVDIPLDFEKVVEMEHVRSNMEAEVYCTATSLEYETIKDESGKVRKIRVKDSLAINTEVYDPKFIEYLSEINKEERSIETQKKEINIVEWIKEEKRNIILTGRVNLPKGYPDIRQVVGSAGSIFSTTITPGEEQVDVDGLLAPQLLLIGYNGNTDEIVSYRYEDTVPFSQTYKVDGMHNTDKVIATFEVRKIETEILHNYEEKPLIVEVTADVTMDLKVIRATSVNLTTDAYSLTNPLKLRKETVSVRAFRNMDYDEKFIREVITVDETEDSISDTALYTYTYPTSKRMVFTNIEDAVFPLGVFLEYFADESEDFMDIKRKVANINVRFDTPLMAEGDDTSVFIEMTDMSVKPLNKREIEVKAQFRINSFIYDIEDIEIIKEVSISEEEEEMQCYLPKNMPALVIYTIKPGDTLWKIARRFCVTVDDILKYNNIENPDRIYPGDKIILYPFLSIQKTKQTS